MINKTLDILVSTWKDLFTHYIKNEWQHKHGQYRAGAIQVERVNGRQMPNNC
jgi:hypothetical protein